MRRWVNLFVLVFIGLVGLGLLLPVVFKQRTVPVGRTRCQEQLRALGVALHQYVDVHGQLPPGTLPNPRLPPNQRLSWLAALLPYLDEADLANRLDPGSGWSEEANRRATDEVVRAFHC